MLPNINLLPKYERQSSLYFMIITGLFIIWLLMLAFFVYQYITTDGKINAIQKESEQLILQKTGLEDQLAEREENRELTHEDAVNYAEKLVLPTSVLIHELIKQLPDYGYLSQYRYHNGLVEIVTQFEELNDGAAYITKLVSSKNIKDAKIDEVVTFEHGLNNEQREENTYRVVPRYHIVYSLEVNEKNLREELKQHE